MCMKAFLEECLVIVGKEIVLFFKQTEIISDEFESSHSFLILRSRVHKRLSKA